MGNTREEWKVVAEVVGLVQAEIIHGMLSAQGIKVQLLQEGAGRALGLEVGSLGSVQVLVPSSSYVDAKSILDSYYENQSKE